MTQVSKENILTFYTRFNDVNTHIDYLDISYA